MAHATTVTAATLARALDAASKALIARWPKVYEGEPPEIHRARVASRRWREVLAVVIAAVSRPHAAELRREVRRITRSLGPVREMDVAIEELIRAAALHGRPLDETERLQAQLERIRVDRRATMRAEVSDINPAWLRSHGREVVSHLGQAWVSDAAWRRVVGELVGKRAADVEAAVASCGTMYVPRRLHAVRIAVKKLRYALEIARAAGEPDLGRSIAALRRVQGDFGHLHDVQVLLEHVRGLAVPRAVTPGSNGTTLVDVLERDCRTLHARLLKRFETIDRLARKAGDVGRTMRRPGRPSMARLSQVHRVRSSGASNATAARGH